LRALDPVGEEGEEVWHPSSFKKDRDTLGKAIVDGSALPDLFIPRGPSHAAPTISGVKLPGLGIPRGLSNALLPTIAGSKELQFRGLQPERAETRSPFAETRSPFGDSRQVRSASMLCSSSADCFCCDEARGDEPRIALIIFFMSRGKDELGWECLETRVLKLGSWRGRDLTSLRKKGTLETRTRNALKT